MNKKNLKRLGLVALILVIVGAVISAVGGSANAAKKGHRDGVTVDHCITHSEWINSVRTDKTRFEKSMGVYQDGRRVVTSNGGDHIVVQYAWCGHPEADGYYQASYDKNAAGYFMANFFTEYHFGQYARKAA